VPVFTDVERSTFNLDIFQVEDVLRQRPKIKAIIPVHLFGGCADMDDLLRLADARGIPVIEDAAQSIGAEYKHRRAGNMGVVACFSFFPSKNLGGYGDGGMLVTGDLALRDRLKALRIHGSVDKYYHEWIGINSRLDAVQAAVLRVKLRHLDAWSEARSRNAAYYRMRLARAGSAVIAPAAVPYQTRHVWNQFVIRCESRDRLRSYLADSGIATEIYYPRPLHLQRCFAFLGYRRGSLPVSEELASTTLALPVYSEIGTANIDYVCDRIAQFYSTA
jgi:dTDP-4-amino-4,6-dideoxygalactose transaminase